MQNKNKCKCGSRDVVYVIRMGRSKKTQMYCERCLPVESGEDHDGPKNLVPQELGNKSLHV